MNVCMYIATQHFNKYLVIINGFLITLLHYLKVHSWLLLRVIGEDNSISRKEGSF